jgi:predicted permease
MPLSVIIVIGWLYVTILIAANEATLVSGIISFLFYGALPCGLLIYFAGSRVRRERQKYREMMAEKAKRDAAS